MGTLATNDAHQRTAIRARCSFVMAAFPSEGAEDRAPEKPGAERRRENQFPTSFRESHAQRVRVGSQLCLHVFLNSCFRRALLCFTFVHSEAQ